MSTRTVGQKIKQLEGLLGTGAINTWESDFIQNTVRSTKQGNKTSHLTEKQLGAIERIFKKHFAGSDN